MDSLILLSRSGEALLVKAMVESLVECSTALVLVYVSTNHY